MEIASEEVRDIIFIQNKKKEDWWAYKEHDKIPKVLKEEFDEVNKKKSKLFFLSFSEFIDEFKNNLEIEQNSIIEIQKTSQEIEEIINNFDSITEELKKIFLASSNLWEDITDGIYYELLDGDLEFNEWCAVIDRIEDWGIDIELLQYECTYQRDSKMIKVEADIKIEANFEGIGYLTDDVHIHVPIDIVGESTVVVDIPISCIGKKNYAKHLKRDDVTIRTTDMEIKLWFEDEERSFMEENGEVLNGKN